MTELVFDKYYMPAASLGPLNCLPDIHNNAYIRSPIAVSDRVTQEERRLIGKGMISTLLPYEIEDGYDRSRKVRGFDSAVLENEYMKAVFLPSLGGRLWSLYDKREKRELLYVNDVFQPCNLALRNAWFSGGVEWNVGIKGHNPLTCDPLFAQEAVGENGEPILKMYEYERIRGVVYSLYASLKDDVLLMQINIENTASEDKWMYWWSNIAVPETKDTRIIVPTDKSFVCSYSESRYFLDNCSLPLKDGIDVTYPARAGRSSDYFYKIQPLEDKWIAAVDAEGKGLLQFSDSILQGRKLFLWGMHNGGRHWNQWLSDNSGEYIEIQAGLLKTQLEHFVMKGNSMISWREGYTLVKGDPAILHDPDYAAAAKSIAGLTESKRFVPVPKVREEKKIRYCGSGWGALENRIREKPVSTLCDFPESSLGAEQADWVTLLETGDLPAHDPDQPIGSYIVGPFWLDLLKKSKVESWYREYHLGIQYYATGDYERSRDAFLASAAVTENAWAYRNLAQLQKNLFKDNDAGAESMLKAFRLKGDYMPILIETACALIDAGQYERWLELYGSLDEAKQAHGRLRLLTALCYTKLGKADEALSCISDDFCVYDIREGEYSISNIWADIHRIYIAKEHGVSIDAVTVEESLAAYPLPIEMDFRMH